MEVHENNLLIKYPVFSDGLSSLSSLDINREDRYSQPKTAKTHIYNYYAVRDAVGRKNLFEPNYDKLNRLYDLYFKGQEATYPRETFFADQEALGNQLKINSSK